MFLWLVHGKWEFHYSNGAGTLRRFDTWTMCFDLVTFVLVRQLIHRFLFMDISQFILLDSVGLFELRILFRFSLKYWCALVTMGLLCVKVIFSNRMFSGVSRVLQHWLPLSCLVHYAICSFLMHVIMDYITLHMKWHEKSYRMWILLYQTAWDRSCHQCPFSCHISNPSYLVALEITLS